MSDRVQELFDQAVALPPEQRATFLEAACAGDAGLRTEVDGLLACDAAFADGGGHEGVLKSPLVRSPAPPAAEAGHWPPASWPPGPPVRLGQYRILRRIAEGGMGSVYEAEQHSPRRIVALKVVRPGLATPAVLEALQPRGRDPGPTAPPRHRAGL